MEILRNNVALSRRREEGDFISYRKGTVMRSAMVGALRALRGQTK
jgi:hypothetical protein